MSMLQRYDALNKKEYESYYQPWHNPYDVHVSPFEVTVHHTVEPREDNVDLSKLQFEVLAQSPPAKKSPKPSQQQKAPPKQTPEHKQE